MPRVSRQMTAILPLSAHGAVRNGSTAGVAEHAVLLELARTPAVICASGDPHTPCITRRLPRGSAPSIPESNPSPGYFGVGDYVPIAGTTPQATRAPPPPSGAGVSE